MKNYAICATPQPKESGEIWRKTDISLSVSPHLQANNEIENKFHETLGNFRFSLRNRCPFCGVIHCSENQNR
jgi:hypothetical protein